MGQDEATWLDVELPRRVIFFATPEMLNRTTELLGPVWSHGFGSTEQGAVTTRLLPHGVVDHSERLHSVGRAGSPFFEVVIMDENGARLEPREVGEIVVRNLARSYGPLEPPCGSCSLNVVPWPT